MSDTEKENAAPEAPVDDQPVESDKTSEKEKSTVEADKLSEKEKSSVKDDEKDKDTAGRAKSAKSAKSARSVNSPTRSARSVNSPTRGASRTGSALSSASAKKGKKSPVSPKSGRRASSKATSVATPKTSEDAITGPPPPEMDVLPDDCVPIFLSGPSQKIYHVIADEDVTANNPYKIITKEEILHDMKMRAAVCDFHTLKKQIMDYPGEEILLVYDRDFKFGENFFVALSEEAKEKILNPPKEEGAEGEEGEGEEAEAVIYKYVPPEPKEWISQGSEKEIDESTVVVSRGPLKMRVRRQRKHFGAPFLFKDRNVADAKDGFIECKSYDDKTFDLKRKELDQGTQAIPDFIDTGTQTDWKYPRNANTQYYPQEFTEEEKAEIMESKEMDEFVSGVVSRFELSLQQNIIMDMFTDDWLVLGDGDDNFGSKADNHLKEFQSFTDLQFSKEKTITYVDWHPTIKGVVAVSVAERISFDDRVDQSSRIIMAPSLILIWSFTDPIHPQLLLEAPDDIHCFKFSPTNPNYIAGGCVNGQLVLWDISSHVERLKSTRSNSKKKNPMNTLKSFDEDDGNDAPIVRYAAVSSIDNSHNAAITDIIWVPDHMEVTRMGVPIENKTQQCQQIMTCATDHSVLFWDIRPTKVIKDDGKIKTPMGVPTTFKHLDLIWKPILRVTLSKTEPGGDHSPTKFSISEKQGERTAALAGATALKEEVAPQNTMAGGFGIAKPSSGKGKTLNTVKTHFYVGTEDGEIVYVDWMPQKDQDTGKIQTPKPDWYATVHDGPIVSLHRSPFFPDIVLCIGGWSFSIWKEGISSGPILSSCASQRRLTGGMWSPSRPSVFFITKGDGSIDIWDVLDRTHEPSLNQGISSMALTGLFPHQISSKQHLLGIGDNAGTLHILEIPWSLRQPIPNENQLVSNYFDREVKRRNFVVERWNFRENEKREIELEAKRKAGIAPNVVLTEEEIEFKMKQEYEAFLAEETSFLRELGLKEDEPLPAV